MVSLSSCNKDESNLNELETEKDNTMLIFNSGNEFEATISEVIQLTDEELASYEQSKGYKSFGRAAEDFYRDIDFESFKSVEEFKSFVNNNSNYLQLIEDDNGELELETKYYNLPERYLINKSHMVQVGENIHRYFKEGIVITNHQNIKALKRSDLDIKEFENKDEYTVLLNRDIYLKSLKSTSGNCGTGVSERSTDGKNRLKIELSLSSTFEPRWDISDLKVRYIQRPYKKTLGVWYWCSRTMKADAKWHYSFVSEYSGEQTRIIENSSYYHDWTHTSKFEKEFEEQYYANGTSFYFTSYDIWGDTHSVSPIHRTCN